MRYCVVAGAILQWSHAPRLRISRGCSRGWSGPTLERRAYCVATARPRKEDEKEGIIRKKATEQPPPTYFSRGELAKATYPAGLICVFSSARPCAAKKETPSRCFSPLVCETAAGVRKPLLSNVSRSLTRVAPRRAIPFPTARSRWFDSRLRVVLRASLAALMGTRAPVGPNASAHLPVWDSSPTHPHLNPLSCCCSVRTFPSRPPPPLLVLLRPSGSHHPSRRIVPPRRTFREDHLPTTVFSSSLGPPPTVQYMPPSFTKQLAETGPTSLPSHSGQTPDMVVLPRCHTGIVRLCPLPLPDSLPLTFLSAAPARLSQQWRGLLASQASRSSPAARPIVPLVWACTSRRRTADPFVKLVSYLQ